MAPQSNVPIWAMGGFNNLLDKSKDKFISGGDGITDPAGPTPFARLIPELGLCDVWRNKFPD